MVTFNLLMLLLSAMVTVPVVVVVAELLLAVHASSRSMSRANVLAVPIAVLVPAHDEAEGIGPVLQAIRQQLTMSDRLVVVADNCTDATARIAHDQRCEVVERHDEMRCGKGYALDFGIAHLARTNWNGAVVVIDADCIPGDDSIAALASAAIAAGRPTQGQYLMRSPSPSMDYALAELAWTVKNHVRPLGLANIDMPCLLFGSGMAFTRPQLEGIPLATGELADDTRLCVELTLRGRPPLYVPHAPFSSTFAKSEDGMRSQRRRWEHGYLMASMRGVPRLLTRTARHQDIRALALALDLLVPPLSLLVMMLTALGAASLGWLLYSGLRGPLVLVAFDTTLLAVALALTWHRFGRPIVSGNRLMLAVPGYVLGKIGLYMSFVTSPQRAWVRTDRNNNGPTN